MKNAITLFPRQGMFLAMTSRGHSAVCVRGVDVADGSDVTVFIDAPKGPTALGGLVTEWRAGANGPVAVFAAGKCLRLDGAVVSGDRVLTHAGRAVVDAPVAPADDGEAMTVRPATAAEAEADARRAARSQERQQAFRGAGARASAPSLPEGFSAAQV